jgi:hypothetical protein
MCFGYKADALLLQIETGHARTVYPVTQNETSINAFIHFYVSVSFYFVDSLYCLCSVMRRANEEVHDSLEKQRKETTRVKDKVRNVIIMCHYNFKSNLTILSLFAVV